MSTRKDSLKASVSPQGYIWQMNWRDRLKQIVVGVVAQVRQLWKLLLVLYIPILIFFMILSLVGYFSDDITLSYLTRDIAAIAGLPFYAGLASQVGALFWAAGLAICIFTFLLLGKQYQDFKPARRFLLHAAILTAALLFDDVFQFHEEIGEDYLGISEKIVVLGYGLLGIIFLTANLNEIFSSEYLILGLGLFLFGMSIFMDAVDLDDLWLIGPIFDSQLQIFAEDGVKLAGIVTWLVFFARYGHQKIGSMQTQEAIRKA